MLTMRNGTIVNKVAAEMKGPKTQKPAVVSAGQEWKRHTHTALSGMERHNGGVDYGQEDEEKVAGPVSWWVYWRYFRAGMATPVIVSVLLLFIATQGEI